MSLTPKTRLESSLDAVGAAVVTINAHGTVLSANDGIETLFGILPEQIVNQNVHVLIPEPYRDDHNRQIARHIETGENRIIGFGRRVYGLHASGETIPLHLSVARYEEDGEIRFTGIFHDLSELDRSLANNTRLGRIIDESSNEVFVFNASDLRFTMVNRGALLNLGYSSDEMRSMGPVDIKPLHTQESFRKLLQPLLAGEKERVRIETVHQRKDGSRYDVEVDLSLPDTLTPPEVIAIVQDVTERNRNREVYRRSQKLQSIGNLTGGIAHDFNNLLTVICGNLELLQPLLNTADQRDLLAEANNAAQMGARLTSRLLAFASKGQLSPRSINLNALVIDISDMLRRTLGESISFESRLSPELWNTNVDVSELENALVNLAINARDAMPGGGKLIVETANVVLQGEPLADVETEPGDYVRLSVIDTGCGISPDMQESVFEPFVTTKRGVHGTGLGLSMVYGFARQSGGKVTLISELGQGSTFSIFLPREATLANAGSGASETAQRFPSTLKILVVEDADAVRKLTVKRLEQMGHEIVEAVNGYQALEIYRAQSGFDLVFTDMVMTAGMSGYDLARAIRELNPAARILMTSGYAEDVIDPDQLEAENFELLRKPFQQADLASAVLKVMDLS